MKLSQNLRFRLEFAGFLLAEAAARALPLEAASWVSGNLWRLIAPLLRRQKRALANLARAFPDMSLAERTDVAAAMWENLGRAFVESFRLKILVESGRIGFSPDEQFDAVARGAPFIVSAFTWAIGRSWRMEASAWVCRSPESTNVSPTHS